MDTLPENLPDIVVRDERLPDVSVGSQVRAWKAQSEGTTGPGRNFTKFLTIGLAPEFEGLRSDELRRFDDQMLLTLRLILAQIKKLPAAERTFDELLRIFTQSPLLQEDMDARVVRNKKYNYDPPDRAVISFFSALHSSEDEFTMPKVVREVMLWFNDLTRDHQSNNLGEMSSIDIEVLAKIVAESGMLVHSFKQSLYSRKFREDTVLDIGVVRYPKVEDPRFQLYRIKLVAWHDCRVLTARLSVNNGITGEFASYHYRPNPNAFSAYGEILEVVSQQRVRIIDELLVESGLSWLAPSHPS